MHLFVQSAAWNHDGDARETRRGRVLKEMETENSVRLMIRTRNDAEDAARRFRIAHMLEQKVCSVNKVEQGVGIFMIRSTTDMGWLSSIEFPANETSA